MLTTVLVASVLAVSAQTDYYTDMDQDDLDSNSTVLGEVLGGPCDDTCDPEMINVFCKPDTHRCECVRGYPVRLGSRGCAKPTGIGEQCFYTQTCMFADPNSDCIQISHNAVCQCKEGYHTVTIPRPKKVFCTEDLVVIATDVSTLLGVATGLAIFTGLICFVLKLFVGGRPRHYANSNLAPPILFAQSASVHSSTSSTKSFSARQFERERENRLLAKARNREKGDGTTPSPSPRSTENLLDDPLPSDSWPKTDDEGRDSEAFTPDILEKGIGGSMAHIDDPLAMAEDNTEPLPSHPPSYEDSEKQAHQTIVGPLGPLP